MMKAREKNSDNRSPQIVLDKQKIQQPRPEDEHVIVSGMTSNSVPFSRRVRHPFQSDIENKNNDELVHSTFRIRKTVVEALSREAEKRGISLSRLVNKTLQDYITNELYFEQLGFILVSKDFLRKTFSRIDVQDMEELGTEIGLTVAREYVSYFFPEVTTDTLVEFLDLWFRRFQSYQHRSNNSGDNNRCHHCFVVNHDINMNFSIVLKAMLQGLMEPILKQSIIFRDITPHSISFSFSRLINSQHEP